MLNLSAFINNVVKVIINPIIGLLFALALFYFVFGLVTFLAQADKPEERAKGTRHMFWGIVGFVIMVAVMGLLTALTGTFGVALPR